MEDKIAEGMTIIDEYSKWLFIWSTMDKLEDMARGRQRTPSEPPRFFDKIADEVRMEALNELGWKSLPRNEIQGFLDKFDRTVDEKLEELEAEAKRSGETSVDVLLDKYGQWEGVDENGPEVAALMKYYKENLDAQNDAADRVSVVADNKVRPKPRKSLRRRFYGLFCRRRLRR